MSILSVMVGGFFGAICRYMLGEWIPTTGGFPVGTLSVNLAGCLLLGWFTAFSQRKSLRPEIPLLIGTGFAGSFTTFSTFSVETLELVKQELFVFAATYVLSSVLAGIALAFVGYRVGTRQKAGDLR
ncbi:fluoride efflux transporter CrcB [Pseudalkalibacillus sp. Hm43]|uniref:fluoride efflux transporter CrcB n=1 Tax=Pseudalkalibacillus sp. Hm43 TaxID=3450742 RepID=UPI003F41BD14